MPLTAEQQTRLRFLQEKQVRVARIQELQAKRGRVQPQGSVPGRALTREEIDAGNQAEFEHAFNLASAGRQRQTNAILSLDPKAKGEELSKLPPLQLLEAASNLGPVRNFSDRRKIIKTLEAKGIPTDAINDYIIALKGPQGIKDIALREAIPTGFEIAGGIAGAAVKKPVRGAVAGRAVGEVVQRAGERIFITERQKSIGKDVTEIGIQSALAGLGEWASRGIVGVGARILKPAGQTKKFGVRGLQESLEEAAKKVTIKDIPEEIGEIAAIRSGGVGLARTPVIPPGAATTSKLFATLDNISDKAVTSMAKVQETRLGANIPAFIKQSDIVLDSFADDLVKQLDPAQLGAVLNDAIEGTGGAREAARGIYRQFYAQLDDLVGGAEIVDYRVVKKIAQDMVDLVDSGKLLKGSDEGANIVRNVAGLSDSGGFQNAITNRSQILELKRSLDVAGDRSASRVMEKLGGALDNAMETAAKQQGNVAEKVWRRGNAVFKAVDKRFNSKVISKLAKEVADSPELAAKTIFQDKLPTRISRVKKILLSPAGKTANQTLEGKQVWKQLKHAYVESIFRKAKSTDGIIFGQNLLTGLDEMGDEALKVIFQPDEIKRLKNLGRTGKLIQGKIVGEGGMLIQLMQPGAAAGAIAGDAKTRLASLGILAIPPVWARMATHPKWSKFLIEGLVDINKKGVKASTAATTKLIKGYFQVRREYLTEQADKERRKQLRERIQRAGTQQLQPFPGISGLQ
jgi:hypothetical protein